jgi:3-oxoacyl-[acyl-carrier-protein] synthase II
MNDAKVMPSDIVAINAHGTSTTIGDKVELESLLTVFSDSAIPVVSTKSIHGHMLGASGAMELVTCLISLSTKKIPATRNLSDPEPSGQLILVRDHPIEIAKAGPILSNSFAFGGSNACLVIGPIDV